MEEIQIPLTKDYSIFKTLKGNRPINWGHVRSLVLSMQENGFLLNPIIINKRGEIIDGQHRLEAAKIIGIPVYYLVAPKYGQKEILAFNTTVKTWTLSDYLHKWIKKGEPAYIAFQEFLENHADFNLTNCLKLVGGQKAGEGGGARKLVDAFRLGKLDMSGAHEADQFLMKVKRLEDLYDGYKRMKFVGALWRCEKYNKFSFDEFEHKLALRRAKMFDCGTEDQYIELIEDIYNYRRADKINLRHNV